MAVPIITNNSVKWRREGGQWEFTIADGKSFEQNFSAATLDAGFEQAQQVIELINGPVPDGTKLCFACQAELVWA